MFTFRIYDADGYFIAETPLQGQMYSLDIDRDCHVEKGEFCYDNHVLALWSPDPGAVRHVSEGDTYRLKLHRPWETSDQLDLLFAAALRFHPRRVASLIYGIAQLRDFFNGTKAGITVHYVSPQAPPRF